MGNEETNKKTQTKKRVWHSGNMEAMQGMSYSFYSWTKKTSGWHVRFREGREDKKNSLGQEERKQQGKERNKSLKSRKPQLEGSPSHKLVSPHSSCRRRERERNWNGPPPWDRLMYESGRKNSERSGISAVLCRMEVHGGGFREASVVRSQEGPEKTKLERAMENANEETIKEVSRRMSDRRSQETDDVCMKRIFTSLIAIENDMRT